MNAREQRGVELAERGRIREEGGRWIVPSQHGDGRYSVYLAEQRCTCPDHQLRRVKCKHIFAVEYAIEHRVEADGTETVTEAVRVTYTQDWSAYNAAQTEEGERLRLMLADLCSLVEQPEQRMGRPRLPLADMTFASVLKVYSGFSSRRFASELRAANERGLIAHVPHFNSVSNYLSDEAMTPVLHELVRLSSLPLRGIERDFAVDSSGFATSGFVRWYSKAHEGVIDNREWVKAHIMVGVETHTVTSVAVSDWTSNDNPYLPALVADTASRFDVREVSADKQYIGRANLAAIEAVGAQPFIPFKANSVVLRRDEGSAWQRMYFYFAYRRDEFLQHYHKRSNVETAFSMIKAKFGPAVRSKSRTGQINEVLAKVLCHNLCALILAMHEIGLTEDEIGFCTKRLTAAQEVSH
jgi:transposase